MSQECPLKHDEMLTPESQNADRRKSIGSRASLFQLVQIASTVLPHVI
jgi:hypothetical protein